VARQGDIESGLAFRQGQRQMDSETAVAICKKIAI
jgi:hypothetical protein